MISIKAIDALTISHFCTHIRSFFLRNDFIEIVLYDTATYSITNINQIKTETGDYLRTTTEPDIWEVGLNYDKYFCITSLFRMENSDSLFHKNEFKILDFYVKNSTEHEILNLIFNCMLYIENELNLPSLSSIDISRCTFETARNLTYHHYTGKILQIDQYPIEESFYDEVDPSTGKTKKGELFYIYDKIPIEFCVYGQVGDNKNYNNIISNFKFEHGNIGSLNIYGACIGIERIIACYEILKSMRG